jgi:hypothetical protein
LIPSGGFYRQLHARTHLHGVSVICLANPEILVEYCGSVALLEFKRFFGWDLAGLILGKCFGGRTDFFTRD